MQGRNIYKKKKYSKSHNEEILKKLSYKKIKIYFQICFISICLSENKTRLTISEKSKIWFNSGKLKFFFFCDYFVEHY